MASEQPANVAARIIENVERVIIGKRQAIEHALIGLVCGGHVLIEDVPGVGKTMLARALAASVGCTFKRIQFTPDLLPSDVTGVSVYDQSTGRFTFREGPIFANIVLADEINRASPRTQSSLLECMEEQQVTMDGVTHQLPAPFLVIATENPIEYEGIYPLPESQLDRFLLRLSMGYPDRADEKRVVKEQRLRHPIESLESVATSEDIEALGQAAREVHVSEPIYDYALAVVRATRDRRELVLGASPRGSLALTKGAQALALIRSREFVLPDDIKELASAMLAHRLILAAEARLSGTNPAGVVQEVLDATPVPEA